MQDRSTNVRNLDAIEYGTNILYRRGSLTYEGTVLEVGDFDGIRCYRVAVRAPGGGPQTDEQIDVHDGQILRVFK